MTLAPASPAAAKSARKAVRLELAWTLSASAVTPGAGYSSAVLHLVVEWDSPHEDGHAECDAGVIRGAQRREVELPGPASVEVSGSGCWRHVSVRCGDRVLLVASFEGGRLAYCTSELPVLAGLRGGTYDAPTGLLELYESAR
jgi:hypothetical protein